MAVHGSSFPNSMIHLCFNVFGGKKSGFFVVVVGINDV